MTWAWNSSSNPLPTGPRPQTPQSTWGFRGGWDFPSASVLEVGEGQAHTTHQTAPQEACSLLY